MQMIHSCIQNDCGECNARISSQQVSPLPSTSGYQQWQGQQCQGRKHAHGKVTNGNGHKWLRKENKEEKEDKDHNHQGGEKTMKVNGHCT